MTTRQQVQAKVALGQSLPGHQFGLGGAVISLSAKGSNRTGQRRSVFGLIALHQCEIGAQQGHEQFAQFGVL